MFSNSNSLVRSFADFPWRAWQFLFLSLLATVWFSVAYGDDDVKFFEQNIEPILLDHCYKCHSHETDEPAGGLLLDTKEGIRRGGESGPAVVPEDLEESLLISAVEYRGLEMPPDEKLDDEAIQNFRTWIQMGAPDPRTDDQDATEDYANSLLQLPVHKNFEGDMAAEWRAVKRKTFEQLYASDPLGVANSVCRKLSKPTSQQFVFAAMSIPRFIQIPVSRFDHDRKFQATWEPLRAAQFQQLVDSPVFRQRFLRLLVWQASFCGQELTERDNDSGFKVECRDIQKRKDACRKACEQTAELSSCEKLNCVILMGLTSRADMIERVRHRESMRSVYGEWSRWFEDSKHQFIQRRDGAGWIRAQEDKTKKSNEGRRPGYPVLILSSSAAADLPPLPSSLRKVFVSRP